MTQMTSAQAYHEKGDKDLRSKRRMEELIEYRETMDFWGVQNPVWAKQLPDGQHAEVNQMTFGNFRINVGPANSLGYEDCW